jgi:arsenate reductase
MAEMGIDISKQRPKHFDELEAINFDYVVTLCNHTYENCPVFGRKTKLIHIGFDDPSKLAMNAKNEEEALDYYRRIRDGIKNYVLGLSDNIKMSFLY